jgi:non-specific serine/threonine protein kinase
MEECLEIEKRINDRMHRIITMLGLGYTNLLHGDYRRAVQIYTDTVELLERRGTPALFIQWLIPMAEMIAKFGKPIASARLLGAATALHESLLAKGDASFVYGELYERVSKPVRAQLDDTTFNAAWNVGHAMTLDQATKYALAEIEIPDASAPSPRQIAKEKFDGLTAREREVAALIAQGKTNRDIADALVLSERTIEGHVSNILNKLDFTARTQIAAWAVEKGLPREDKISQ